MSGAALLPPASRQRLVRFCGMLGSDHDGERANAARMADRLIREAGLTWEAVIAVPAALHRPASQAQPQPDPGASGMGRVAEAQRILALHRALLTQWEADFLQNIAGWRGPLSSRQQAVFDRIATKIAAKAQRPAW
jgi:hypothetical protein